MTEIFVLIHSVKMMNTIGLYDYRKTKTPAKFTKHTFKIIKYNIRKSRNKLFENIPRIKNHKYCHRYFKAVVAAINKNKITKVNMYTRRRVSFRM